jgi:hypothetical protein
MAAARIGAQRIRNSQQLLFGSSARPAFLCDFFVSVLRERL